MTENALNARNLLVQDFIMEINVEQFVNHANQLEDNTSEKMENVKCALTTAESHLIEDNAQLFHAKKTQLSQKMVSANHVQITL